jgi:ariadne-1
MKISDVKPTVKRFLQEMLDLYEADPDTCIKIAMHYRWNREKMDAEWFEAKQDLEKRLGITFDESIAKQNPEMQESLPGKNGGYCLICYEEFSSKDDSFALSCRHSFCTNCWTQYLCEKVESGFHGIDAQCMQAKCNLKVDHSVFE